jgi:exodeoxyribonuclease VII large subunit
VLARCQRDQRRLAEGLARAGRRRVELAAERCAALARLAAQLDPQRVLQRGFSITRGPGGAVLRAAGGAVPGTLIRTQLAAGELSSRVEEIGGRESRTEEP